MCCNAHTLLKQAGLVLMMAFSASSRLVDKPDCSLPAPELKQHDPNENYGYIHDIIGKDGALMLTLVRNAERWEYSSNKLKEAGIIATQFPAADGYCESEIEVERGCPLNVNDTTAKTIDDQCRAKQGWGWGCNSVPTAACTESHHRALEMAQYRKHDWTLIMEDDAVPVHAESFQEKFKEVWAKMPDFAKFVRLGWCSFPANQSKPFLPPQPVNEIEYLDDSGDFKIARNITSNSDPHLFDAGMCQTAYMVHRDIIPEVLGVFPCCCIIDCCLTGQLFNRKIDPDNERITWGYKNMVSIDMYNSTEMTTGWNKHPAMYQFGPLAQDNRETATVRWMQMDNKVEKSTSLQMDNVQSELEALMHMLHAPGVSS